MKSNKQLALKLLPNSQLYDRTSKVESTLMYPKAPTRMKNSEPQLLGDGSARPRKAKSKNATSKGVLDLNTIKVSTFAYCRVFMLVKIAATKAATTKKKALTLDHSNLSALTRSAPLAL